MRNSSGVENGPGIQKYSPQKQSTSAAQNRGTISEKGGMKVTYFQNTFSKQQLRPYTLRFRNKELEVEYESELMRNNKTFYTFASTCVSILSLCAAIRFAFEGDNIWIVIIMGVNTFFHITGFFLIRYDFTHLRQMIFCSNVINILVYSYFLGQIGDRFSTGQLIFLEDIFFSVVMIFMRTHMFILDSSTIIVSRFIIVVILMVKEVDDSTFSDYFLFISLCIVSGILNFGDRS